LLGSCARCGGLNQLFKAIWLVLHDCGFESHEVDERLEPLVETFDIGENIEEVVLVNLIRIFHYWVVSLMI